MLSEVTPDDRNVILSTRAWPAVPDGQPLASAESVMVMSLAQEDGRHRTQRHPARRAPLAFEVRGGIRVTSGRAFRPGLAEVMAGRRIRERVRDLDVGSRSVTAGRT
jgi:hypothetical protein